MIISLMDFSGKHTHIYIIFLLVTFVVLWLFSKIQKGRRSRLLVRPHVHPLSYLSVDSQLLHKLVFGRSPSSVCQLLDNILYVCLLQIRPWSWKRNIWSWNIVNPDNEKSETTLMAKEADIQAEVGVTKNNLMWTLIFLNILQLIWC